MLITNMVKIYWEWLYLEIINFSEVFKPEKVSHPRFRIMLKNKYSLCKIDSSFITGLQTYWFIYVNDYFPKFLKDILIHPVICQKQQFGSIIYKLMQIS